MLKIQCPKDCERNCTTGSTTGLIGKCPIGTNIPPQLVRDRRFKLCPYYLNREMLQGIKKGIKAWKAGKVKPWSEVKKELGMD